MARTIDRAAIAPQLSATLGDAAAISDAVGIPTLPADLADWLSRLLLLKGVPYRYLVPDVAMVPPEAIRFFQLDANWIAALIDGALSIGRNLTDQANTPGMALDTAIAEPAHVQVYAGSRAVRAVALGIAEHNAADASSCIGGFLLRSALVSAYPGMGVNAYQDRAGTQPLPLLRLEHLGPDVLIALVAGAAARVDIHEPPESLHFGIDVYRRDDGTRDVAASKNVLGFTTTTDPVGLNTGASRQVDFAPLFRTDSPRTLRLAAVRDAIGARDSAELGFIMTEGVGLVSFVRGAS